MKNAFIDLLLDVTEAALGAISLFQENINIAENKVEFTISQSDIACLFYSAWPYVASAVGRPPDAGPESLFLFGLTDRKIGERCEDWSRFADDLRQSKNPFQLLQNKFKACDEQASFSVDSSKLINGKRFIDETIYKTLQYENNLQDKMFHYGQVDSQLNVFLQVLLIVNQQQFSVSQRIDSYMRLFLLFYDGNLADELDEYPPSNAFDCMAKSKRDYLKDILTNKSGNEQLRAIGKFIFGEITPSLDETINMVAGRCYQLGKAYYEDINSWKSEEDMDVHSSMNAFCGFFYMFDYMQEIPLLTSFSKGPSEKEYRPGKKYDNFYYWVSKAKYNYS